MFKEIAISEMNNRYTSKKLKKLSTKMLIENYTKNLFTHVDFITVLFLYFAK